MLAMPKPKPPLLLARSMDNHGGGSPRSAGAWAVHRGAIRRASSSLGKQEHETAMQTKALGSWDGTRFEWMGSANMALPCHRMLRNRKKGDLHVDTHSSMLANVHL